VSTWQEARAELEAALGASDRPVDPPYAMVWNSGSELRLSGSGATRFRFRVTCVGPFSDDDAGASRTLGLYVAEVLAILVALRGWTIDSLGPDQTRTIAGGTFLTADITVTTQATLT
jgi:hypothetical protein